jgi:uncharacterized membrane protein YcaP (DUF421 family)
MEHEIRGLVVYVILLVIFRISGKRTLSETSTFDLVLLLIISETTQQAMVDDDHSVTAGVLLIMTLVCADIGCSMLKSLFPRFETALEGNALILVENGQPNKLRLARERVDEDDILEAARMQQGLERLSDIKYAVLERGGKITIIARDTGGKSENA